MALIFSDNANRADTAPGTLGTGWRYPVFTTAPTGGWVNQSGQILANKFNFPPQAIGGFVHPVIVGNGRIEATIVSRAGAGEAVVYASVSESTGSYYGMLVFADRIGLYRVTATTFDLVGTFTNALAANSVVSLIRRGASREIIAVASGGVERIAYTDPAPLPNGFFAIGSDTATIVLDDVFIYDDPPPPPIVITNQAPLPSAEIGKPYSVQLQKTGGAAGGAWSQTVGNLPAGAMPASGLISIAPAGTTNYTFTARFTDSAGAFAEKSLTIPVFAFASIAFCHRQPLEIKYLTKTRVFEPLAGDDEVIEDAPVKRIFAMNTRYIGSASENELRAFLFNHRLRKKFYWINPDRNNESILVKLVSEYSEIQSVGSGDFEFTLKEV